MDSRSTREAPTIVCHAVVLAPDGDGVLVLHDADGWTLPHIAAAEPGPWFDVLAVNRGFQALLGLRTTVLRCLVGDDNTRPAEARIYALEGHDPTWSPPPGARWLGRAELPGAPLREPDHRPVIAAWLDELAGLDGARWPAWTRPGWFAAADRFVAAALDARGVPCGPREQLRTWQRSCVLRGATPDGGVIFKASPAMFPHEPAVSRYLSREFPGTFPEVLAVDEDRRWTLMRALDGPPLLAIAELERWAAALRTFARVQLQCASRVDALVACGCPRWPLERISSRTEAMLADTAAMLIGTADGLHADEVRELQASAPMLREITQRLFAGPVPLTLEHGDLRSVQVVATAGEYAYFDLSDSAVTHPFFSAVTLIDFEDIPLAPGATREAARQHLRGAYLEVWRDHGTPARLVAAFELARVVAVLYAALCRYDIILPRMEPKARWEFMIPFWQRRLLAALKIWSEGAP